MSTKRSYLLFIILLSINFCFAQTKPTNNTFTLKGNVEGNLKGYIYLNYLDEKGKEIMDSCLLKKGNFQFEGNLSEPRGALLIGPEKSFMADAPNTTAFFLEPTSMQVSIESGKFKEALFTGSQSQKEFSVNRNGYEAIRRKYKIKLDEVEAAKNFSDSTSERIVDELRLAARNEAEQYTTSFIKQNPDSYVSAYLLAYGSTYDLTALKAFYKGFTPRIQQSAYGKAIAEIIKKEEATAIGNPAPDFTQNNILGIPVSLSNYKGKYVLLEFWASWCTPCRAENPSLKKVYETFKDKNFTILGVSLDVQEKKEDWLTAIEKDGLPWMQVSDLKGFENEVALKYNVSAIPMNFLIDPDGKIVAIDLKSDELKKFLEKIYTP